MRNPDSDTLLTYVADLELEVDRLRKQGQFVQTEVQETLKRIHLFCRNNPDPTQSRRWAESTRHQAVVGGAGGLARAARLSPRSTR